MAEGKKFSEKSTGSLQLDCLTLLGAFWAKRTEPKRKTMR
jgi:hypothetical protein